MLYAELVKAYKRIEATTKRLEITQYLTDLFKTTPLEVIDKVTYLTQGKIYPDFVGLEIGLAEKLGLRALSFATGLPEKELTDTWKRTGDLGETSLEAIKKKRQTALFFTPLTVERVYRNFDLMAKATGSGAQDLKIKLFADLLHDSKPKEAKYMMRTAIGKLRLGVADMTILDALALAFGKKKDRAPVERAYNLCSDMGRIAKVLCEKGVAGVKKLKIHIGIPIRMMLAERLSSVPEIFDKLGKCAFEYKYDGLRVQAHLEGEKVKLFSRRLENITLQFPDVCEVLRECFKGKAGVLEGECVPVNVHTGELLPFQEVSHRRGRKYGVEEAAEEYPVVLFLFDLLYLNGEDLTRKKYPERREFLKKYVKVNDRVKLSTVKVTREGREVDKFFNQSIESGCEGLVAKSIGDESLYRAGARGWLWIKYKRDYKSELIDTVDLVPLGGFAGRGGRKGTYGALLMGCYDSKNDEFETVCKLGTGFTDQVLAKLPKIFERVGKKHPRVNSEMEPDYWFLPERVLEVGGAEITLSPVHTCAYGKLRKDAGLAIRFPRFTGRWREDKSAEQATTSEEIIEMYKRQLKKLE